MEFCGNSNGICTVEIPAGILLELRKKSVGIPTEFQGNSVGIPHCIAVMLLYLLILIVTRDLMK